MTDHPNSMNPCGGPPGRCILAYVGRLLGEFIAEEPRHVAVVRPLVRPD
jgi:hypothetical protein